MLWLPQLPVVLDELFLCCSCGASGSSVTPKETPDAGEEKDVPVVPFGIDLYYWGKEQPTAGKIIKYDDAKNLNTLHETS